MPCCGGGGAFEPPPPQPTKSAAAISIVARPAQARRVRDHCRSALVEITKLSNSSSHGSTTRKPGERIGGRTPGSKDERAIVETLTVTATGFAPLNAAGLGETEQVEGIGAPLQVNETLPLNPFEPLRLSEKLAVCPAEMV